MLPEKSGRRHRTAQVHSAPVAEGGYGVSRVAAIAGRRLQLPQLPALRTYAALASAGSRRYATYRQATVAAIFTNTVFGFLRCSVLLAVIPAADTVAGYDRHRMATFVWVGLV
jgi:ABC-2 type transport system permease protein